MKYLEGFDIRIGTMHPKRQLALDVPVSDEVRAETNRWMLDFFGSVCEVKSGHIEADAVNQIVWMNDQDYQRVASKLSENEEMVFIGVYRLDGKPVGILHKPREMNHENVGYRHGSARLQRLRKD